MAASLEVRGGYRINEENGAFFPQRLNESGVWVYYTDVEYGRRFNVGFKTKRGAANFLDLQSWMDTPYQQKNARMLAGDVSVQILKKLNLYRKDAEVQKRVIERWVRGY